MVAEEKYTLQKLRLNPNVLTYQNLDMIPYDEEKINFKSFSLCPTNSHLIIFTQLSVHPWFRTPELNYLGCFSPRRVAMFTLGYHSLWTIIVADWFKKLIWSNKIILFLS